MVEAVDGTAAQKEIGGSGVAPPDVYGIGAALAARRLQP